MVMVPSAETATALTCPISESVRRSCEAPSAAASEKLGSIASLEASHAEPPVMPWLTTTVTATQETTKP